ncbi:DUF6688 family protein [Tamlana sp. 2201CG12-4]|uniref:DUF6688 domain-containing protein n=1 Tax=Tamlana sp. 2201CG12-4 TaxID=3112582 RepID=UPI002DBC6357|nr:DUF6688 family protein [Tamlana sp. 2201CG12-4]MEC3907236.1 DUF6688 family protein [Tamlana sp. 2201CG12-4]
MGGFVFLFALVVLIVLATCILIVRQTKRQKHIVIIELIIIIASVVGFLLFLVGMSLNSEPYYKAIDPIDSGYEPLAQKHILTAVTIAILGMSSTIMIWKRKKELPPLLLALCIFFMHLFSVFLIFIIIQTSKSGAYFMWIGPLTFIIASILLSISLAQKEAKISKEKYYKNKTLSFLNDKLSRSSNYGFWLTIVLLPILLILVLILTLFGQDYDSIVKVFTETSTWTFSQKTHPPYLDHKGHYLCTVAACGSPKIVKPKRLGTRNGNTIIVNRQLMVANAFEEMIQEKFKKGHKIIRRLYDKYGYPLSKKINSELWSNITYVIMKPLEWIFLISLYLFCLHPEKRIKKQYELK